MTSFKGRRAQLGTLLAVALGAISIFALPGLASARGGSDDDSSSGSSSATIESFDQTSQALVVALPDGQTVSGTVTSRTKIRCEDQRGRGRGRGGDDVRGRKGESGDDRGSHDDNGSGANCTTADLVAGAAVEEIDLEFRGDTVVFDEVELDD